MRAALFYGGKDIRVEHVPTPEPGPGEVLPITSRWTASPQPSPLLTTSALQVRYG